MLLGSTLSGGMKLQKQQGYDKSLSQALTLGTDNRLFFKLIKNDEGGYEIPAASIAGRNLNWDKLKLGFLVEDGDMIELTDGGKLIDKTGLSAWVNIAYLLRDAACVDEKESAEDKAKRDADKIGVPIDQVELSKTLEGIELRYHGGEAADGTRISPKENLLISPLRVYTYIQCLLVPMDKNGAPDWKNAQSCSLDVKNKKAQQLFDLLSKPQYVNADDMVLEVGYSYKGEDKQKAGQAASFQGISTDTSIKTLYPDDWNKYGVKKLEDLFTDAEMIKAKNGNANSRTTVADVISAIRKYCATNLGVMACINFEKDEAKKAANDLVEFGLLDSVPKIKQMAMSVVETSSEEKESTEATAEEAAEQEAMQNMKDGKMAQATTLTEMQAAAGPSGFGDDDDISNI